MNIFEQIREAIWELELEGCKRVDLIIAYSPLIERFIVEEVYKMRVFNPNIAFQQLKEFEGIKIYALHPYNEIVVYDSINSAYNPNLIKKIEVPNHEKTFVKQ